MASIKFVTIPAKRLSQSIDGSAYVFQLSDILRFDLLPLSAADFGTLAFGSFRNVTGTILEIFQYDPTTIASAAGITILKRGLDFSGGLVEIAANKLTWIKGETIVELGSNPPQLLSYYLTTQDPETINGLFTFMIPPQIMAPSVGPNDAVRKSDVLTLNGNQTLTGIKTFAVSPQVPTPTNSGDAVNMAYVLSLVLGGNTLPLGFNKATITYDSLGRVKTVRDNELGIPYIITYDSSDTPIKVYNGTNTWRLNYTGDILTSITKI